ncbi:hypothetical protein [Sphingomonas colocasiae]|uniref:Uncharacterized protein n=1 Tax=Sphingomonas colocasiae TaxID=1848973 RepID=A0ABS7PPU4_9SPHN|nr:hypothetical protein [Sphingomonas colocasiae]MBY8823347.1 hypothetical protein [Sphingomonas colocasiae]
MGLTINSTTNFASGRRAATARIARPISRCSFNLTDTAAFEKTIEACVEWMAPKAGGNLPVEALRGAPFDLVGQYQANPCRAVRLDVPDGSVWAAWLSEFSDGTADGTPPRNWITELFVERRAGEMVRFGAQLSFLGRPDDRDFILTRPRLVRNILEVLSAEADGQPMQEVPAQIGEADVHEFEALVYSQGRRLPIIALSQNADGNYLVNPLQVARRLSGAAHVAELDVNASWALTKSVGKQMSVFGGAVRIYMPGLTTDDEERFRHPLFLYPLGMRAAQFIDMLASRLLPLTLRDVAHERPFLRFSEVRAAAATMPTRTGGGQVERISDLELANSALSQRVEALEADLQSADALNDDEVKLRLDVEAREEELKNEIEILKRRLTAAMSARPATVPEEEVPARELESYEDLPEWAEEVLAGSVVIMQPALRDCRKTGSDNMLRRLESVLLILKNEYVPARRSKSREDRAAADASLQRLGFEDTPCFATRDDASKWSQYSVVYKGRRTVLYDHFKNGNGTDNSSQARIYYHWDEEDGALVIGKMPSHLPNSHTN